MKILAPYFQQISLKHTNRAVVRFQNRILYLTYKTSKMEANNIFLKAGQKFRVVGIDEPLQAHFLVRNKHESPMLSESGGWDTTYKRDGWLGTAWHTVEDELPVWVGKPALELFEKGINFEIIEIL